MLTLGDILAAARRSALDVGRLGLDPALSEGIARSAAAEGSTPGQFLRQVVAEFSAEAGPDEWTQLMSGLRDSADPGRDCLVTMVNRRLARYALAAREE